MGCPPGVSSLQRGLTGGCARVVMRIVPAGPGVIPARAHPSTGLAVISSALCPAVAPKMLLWACRGCAGVPGLSSSGHSRCPCPAVSHAVWAQRMNPVGEEGWASLCNIFTYGKLHLEVERGLGTAVFAVPHSDFASCFSHLSAWWDLFQHLHPSSICPFPCFCFAVFFPLPRHESCLLWVGL